MVLGSPLFGARMADLDHKDRAEPTKIVGADPTTGEETNYLEILGNNEAQTSDIINHAAVYDEITVGLTAVEAKVGATALELRKLLHITPKGSKIYWGYDNLVTTVTGTRLYKGTTAFFGFGPGASTQVWLISDTAGIKVNIGEGA